MKKIYRYLLRAFLIFLIIIPVATFGHFFIFPQETRSILIDFSDFKKDGMLYFDVNIPRGKIDSLELFVKEASSRVTKFWGKKVSNPKFIYCD